MPEQEITLDCGPSTVHARPSGVKMALLMLKSGDGLDATTVGAYLDFEQAKKLADILYKIAENR